MRHELGPQDLQTGVKFGMLDGNAVRFTNFKAWWLVDGAWQPISPGEVLSDAAVMREARIQAAVPSGPSSRTIVENGITCPAREIITRVSGVRVPPPLPTRETHEAKLSGNLSGYE